MNDEKNTPEPVNGKQLAMVIGLAVLALFAFVAIYFASAGYFNKSNNAAQSPSPSATTATNSLSGTPSPTAAPQISAAPQATNSSGLTASAPAASPKAAPSTKYTHEQSMKMAQDVAKKQFGDDAVVLPADEGIAVIVNIDGVDRACFMFGADSMSQMVKNGSSMRGLYHFDANTGEVFDNGSGKMVKVN